MQTAMSFGTHLTFKYTFNFLYTVIQGFSTNSLFFLYFPGPGRWRRPVVELPHSQMAVGREGRLEGSVAMSKVITRSK